MNKERRQRLYCVEIAFKYTFKWKTSPWYRGSSLIELRWVLLRNTLIIMKVPRNYGTIFHRNLSQYIIILNLELCFWRSKKIKGKSFWQDMFELFLDFLYTDGFTTIVMGRSKLSNMILYAITKKIYLWIHKWFNNAILRSSVNTENIWRT